MDERRRDADSDWAPRREGHRALACLAETRGGFSAHWGLTNIRTFVSPDDPKKVAVLMDIPDMDAVMSFMQTQEAADAMAFDGVLPETLVLLVEQRPA